MLPKITEIDQKTNKPVYSTSSSRSDATSSFSSSDSFIFLITYRIVIQETFPNMNQNHQGIPLSQSHSSGPGEKAGGSGSTVVVGAGSVVAGGSVDVGPAGGSDGVVGSGPGI